MATKYCTNCGHGNPPMSNGTAVNFCAKCGTSLNNLAVFGAPAPKKKAAPASRRRRFSRDEEEDFEDELEDEFEDEEAELDQDDVNKAFRNGMSIDMSDYQGPLKAGDVVGMGATGFERPKGQGDYDEKKFRSDSATKKGNPDIIGGNG